MKNKNIKIVDNIKKELDTLTLDNSKEQNDDLIKLLKLIFAIMLFDVLTQIFIILIIIF